MILELADGQPAAVHPEHCIACGHCVAVCPRAALDHTLAPLAKQVEIAGLPSIDQETASRFMRSRRSIRAYKETRVPRELLLQLVDMARLAPTGSNTQGVSFIVVEDKKLLERAAETVFDWLEKSPLSRYFGVMIQAYREKGIDTVLRGAPHLVLALTDREFSRGRENTIFALAYLELYASALGLGSCWAGIFEHCVFSGYEPLVNLFQLPAGKKITGAVMVGYPQYRHQRLTDRKPLDVAFL
jgi:nitroreductase